jgi:hypothetical protein
MSRQARALKIAEKIAELRAEIRPIEQAIRELTAEHELLFQEEEAPAPSVPKLKTQGKRGRPPAEEGWTPLKAKLITFFSHVDERGVDIDTISAAVGNPNRQTLRAALVELTKAHQLDRIGKGIYRPRTMALVVAR